MSFSLYVGNISFKMKADELKKAFSEFGNVVSVKIIMDKQTGKSKGYGFVEMSTEDEAKQAMDALNGQELKGRALKINLANQQKE